MRLMQLNCWAGKLGTQLKRLEEDIEADIVCLQEAYDIPNIPGNTFISPNEVFKPEKYPHNVFAETITLRYQKQLSPFGNAIYSRTPISATETHFTNGEKIEDLDVLGGDDYNARNFVHAVIDYNGVPLNIITHHGHHHPVNKLGGEENTRQLELIAEYIDSLRGPIIFTGDLNLYPESPSLEPITSRLRNLIDEFPIGTTRTEISKRPNEIVDYVFVSDNVKVCDYKASDILASDHKALVLDFEI